ADQAQGLPGRDAVTDGDTDAVTPEMAIDGGEPVGMADRHMVPGPATGRGFHVAVEQVVLRRRDGAACCCTNYGTGVHEPEVRKIDVDPVVTVIGFRQFTG